MSKKKTREIAEFPEIKQIESELKRVRYRERYRRTFRSTVYMLIVVAAMAVLIATLWMPVLRIYGASMSPTLENGNIVVTVKETELKTGEIVAFYYNNKILVKRVIAVAGDWVDMDGDGTVYVNGTAVEEPYVTEKSFGECDLELPYQVPESKYFVMGDHRSVSLDSRSSDIGCVSEEQLVGKLVFRFWPLTESGIIR